MVKESELRELRNMILWFIEGYKYFYLKYYNNDDYDEDAMVMSFEAGRIIDHLSKNILNEYEIGKFRLLDRVDEVDIDTKNLKELFGSSALLNDTNIMNRFYFEDNMKHFLNEENDYSDFTILMLAAGAYGMHKDRIVELTGKELKLERDEVVPTRYLDEESLDMACTISNNSDVSSKESLELMNSLVYLYNYIKKVNYEKKTDTEYEEDVYTKIRIKKPRL